MKVYKVLVPSFILPVFLVSFLGISDAEASELCWEATDQKNGSKFTIRLGVLQIGDGHFLLSGKATSPAFPGEVAILHGNAEIEGNNILMTFTDSKKDNIALSTSIDHLVLDRSTLNGTAESIGHDYNYFAHQPFISGDIFIDSDTEYSTFPITNIPCP